MRRITSLTAVLAIVLFSLAAMLAPRVMAQDATPAAGPPPEQEGVTFTPIGFAPGIALPSTGDMILVDIELEPGAVSPFDAADPTGGLLYVESGEFTIKLDGVAWGISRGEALAASMASGTDDGSSFEMVEPGQDATLSEGDVAWVPGSVDGELRNDGTETAEGTIFLIAPGGTLGGPPEGTPAP